MLFFERFTIFSDNGGWDTISIEIMVKDEFGYFGSGDEGEWNFFHPFSKIFFIDNDEFMSIR
jgi:hypothetical protein